MAQRHVLLDFTFEDLDEYGDGDVSPTLTKIERTHSDLDRSELSGLGEEIAQTDKWQVDRWQDIQAVLGGSRESVTYGQDF